MACTWVSSAFIKNLLLGSVLSRLLIFLLVSCTFLGVCAVNGLLYVVGGDDGSCNLSTVEYYNPTTDKWTVVSSCMSTGRSYAGKAYRYF